MASMSRDPQEHSCARLPIVIRGSGAGHLCGNAHTFPGRISAWSDDLGYSVTISKDELVDPSADVQAWVSGFLAGQEPRFAEFIGVDEPYDDDLDEDPSLNARYRAFLHAFHATGHFPFPLHRRPTAPPPEEWEQRAWLTVAGEVLRWDGSAWIKAEPQPTLRYELIEGTICFDRGHCGDSEWFPPDSDICRDCGRLSTVFPIEADD